MMSKKTMAGDIIFIPLERGFKPAKILYVSQRYKDTILLGVYKNSIANLRLPSDLTDNFELLIYTSKIPIQKKRWHRVGHEELRSAQKNSISGSSLGSFGKGIPISAPHQKRTKKPCQKC